jgi:hypothetical protein
MRKQEDLWFGEQIQYVVLRHAGQRLVIDCDNRIAKPEGSIPARNDPCLITADFTLEGKPNVSG